MLLTKHRNVSIVLSFCFLVSIMISSFIKSLVRLVNANMYIKVVVVGIILAGLEIKECMHLKTLHQRTRVFPGEYYNWAN